MMEYAVWTWFDKLLNSYDTRFPWRLRNTTETQPLRSPLTTIKTLLVHGADLHCGGSQRTLLDGLVLNIIQFDCDERSQKVLDSCMLTWLAIVQELGFDLKEYLSIERQKLAGMCYDLGSGIHMMLFFNDEAEPHIY